MADSADLKRIGRYDIEGILGEGAMGVVYAGNDSRLQRKVAIKTILKSALDSDSAKDYSMRFAREAQAVARLNHPNIVQVFDFAEEGNVAYIVMEYVKGKELKNFFEAKERFELKEVVHIMGELCHALHFAHEAAIIHRDVKPANVMIDSQGHVKLTDFGVARINDPDRNDRTQAGAVVGTPAYMSPEQIQGGKLDARSDIFSAGVILYEFLTGTKPFAGQGAWTIAKKIISDEPALPSSINHTLSPLFDAVVAKALAKSAANRYQTAREFAYALKRALDGLPEMDEAERTVILPFASKAQRAAAAHAEEAVIDPTILRTLPAPQAPRSQEAELEFWRAIKDGNDPDDFDLYVQQFPNGIYAALAKRKSARLRGAAPTDAAGKAAQQEQERGEVEEAARREGEVNAALAAERAELEARLAKREAEFAKREADLSAREAAGPKRASLMPVAATIALAALIAVLWFVFKPPDPMEQRVAELTRMLEESKKREAALVLSRQREAELVKELELARAREAEARKAGDVTKQRELAEQVKQREAEARKQAELVRQREAEARVADQRRAELAKIQADATAKKKPEPVRPPEPAKAPEPVKQVEAPKPAPAPEPVKAAEPEKLAMAAPAPAVPALSAETLLQRAMALESDGKNAEAVRLYRQAARTGSGAATGQAAKRLGDLLQRKGVPGVSYDYAEALKYYEIARSNGVDPGAIKPR